MCACCMKRDEALCISVCMCVLVWASGQALSVVLPTEMQREMSDVEG